MLPITCPGCGGLLETVEDARIHRILCHPPSALEILLGVDSGVMHQWIGRSIETMARGTCEPLLS